MALAFQGPFFGYDHHWTFQIPMEKEMVVDAAGYYIIDRRVHGQF